VDHSIWDGSKAPVLKPVFTTAAPRWRY